ncbi:hypothetical protein Q8F55_009274 [Vanrija albida]|uniref:F-box domain-containing protein n=1 Tax=Vanrija albida TaxID=181172 RepID=A0ABR3PTC8_9TREE
MQEPASLPFERLPDHINHDLGRKFMDFTSLHHATRVSRTWRAFFAPVLKRRVLEADLDPRETQLHLRSPGKTLLQRLDADDRLDGAYARGEVHVRWIPHVLPVDNLSVCRVDPVTGAIVLGKGPNSSNVNDTEWVYSQLEVDSLLRPATSTPPGGYTRSMPFLAHHGTASAVGLGAVLCRVEMDDEGIEWMGLDELLAIQSAQLWVSDRDYERFTVLDDLDGDVHLWPSASESIDGYRYLASFPYHLHVDSMLYREPGTNDNNDMEMHPSMDKLFALHVDYDDDGATGIVTAYADQRDVMVRPIAIAKGAPAALSLAQATTMFPHGLTGDEIGYLDTPVVRVLLDNEYIFAANSTNLKVFKRGVTPELVLHINSDTWRDGGPAFDLSLDAVAARLREAPSRTVPRRDETVPNSASEVRRVAFEARLPGDDEYADLTVNHQFVEHDGFALKPETLAIAGRNLVFAAEKKVFIVPGYAGVLRAAADAAPEDRIKALMPHLVEFCLDDPEFAIAAYGNKLAYATSAETFFFDLREIPPLPAREPFTLHAHAVTGATRDFTKGGSFNTRFMLGPGGLDETVSLAPGIEAEYRAATEGSPPELQWKPEWNDVQGDQWDHWYHPCAVRVFSFAPGDEFAADSGQSKDGAGGSGVSALLAALAVR